MLRLIIIFAVLIPSAFVLMWLVKARWQARHLDNAQRRKELRTEIELTDEEAEILELEDMAIARRQRLDTRRAARLERGLPDEAAPSEEKS